MVAWFSFFYVYPLLRGFEHKKASYRNQQEARNYSICISRQRLYHYVFKVHFAFRVMAL